MYLNRYDAPIGGITIASDGEKLAGLWFDGQRYSAANITQGYKEKDLPIFALTKEWLDIYFTGKAPDFTPPLSITGVSPFRKRVWEIMLKIPYGKTVSYGDIARRIAEESGKRVSAQAVGGAVGHNRIAIIIPCHRVVGANKNLTGYAGGIDKKIKLLETEGVDPSLFTLPRKGTAL